MNSPRLESNLEGNSAARFVTFSRLKSKHIKVIIKRTNSCGDDSDTNPPPHLPEELEAISEDLLHQLNGNLRDKSLECAVLIHDSVCPSASKCSLTCFLKFTEIVQTRKTGMSSQHYSYDFQGVQQGFSLYRSLRTIYLSHQVWEMSANGVIQERILETNTTQKIFGAKNEKELAEIILESNNPYFVLKFDEFLSSVKRMQHSLQGEQPFEGYVFPHWLLDQAREMYKTLGEWDSKVRKYGSLMSLPKAEQEQHEKMKELFQELQSRVTLYEWFKNECVFGKKRGKGLLLYSEMREVGKTSFAKELVRNIPSRWMYFRSRFNKKEFMEKVSTFRLLILDDFHFIEKLDLEPFKALLSGEETTVSCKYLEGKFPGGRPTMMITNSLSLFKLLKYHELFSNQLYFVSVRGYLGPPGTDPRKIREQTLSAIDSQTQEKLLDLEREQLRRVMRSNPDIEPPRPCLAEKFAQESLQYPKEFWFNLAKSIDDDKLLEIQSSKEVGSPAEKILHLEPKIKPDSELGAPVFVKLPSFNELTNDTSSQESEGGLKKARKKRSSDQMSCSDENNELFPVNYSETDLKEWRVAEALRSRQTITPAKLVKLNPGVDREGPSTD